MRLHSVIPAGALATILLTTTASAQGVNPLGGTWDNVFVPGASVNEFWNNLSNDGLTCNVGYFVTGIGAGGPFGPCANTNPAGFPSPLGWTSASYLAFSPPSTASRVLFEFDPGSYYITFLGQIDAVGRAMGVRSTNGSNQVNWTFGSAPETIFITALSHFEFFIDSWLPSNGPTRFFSRSGPSPMRQFAVFANGPDGQTASEWLVGAENNACVTEDAVCAAMSDFDFNDGLAYVSLNAPTIVPEPSTFFLLATGLLSLGALAARRRKSA